MSDFWGEGPGPGFRPPRGPGGPGGRPGRRRVDLRAAVLRLLAEQPMNGSQLIQELSRRSDGRFSPRPESVYAVLQMLEDEGLVQAVESAEGRRVHELTEAGQAEASGPGGAGDGAGDAGGAESGPADGEATGASGEILLGAMAEAARVFVAAATKADGEQRTKLVTALRGFREAVLEVVPGADRSGPFPPWVWGWGRGSGGGGRAGGRGRFPDFPDWLSNLGGGGWPGGPGGSGRGPGAWWRGWGPAAASFDPDEEGDDDEIW